VQTVLISVLGGLDEGCALKTIHEVRHVKRIFITDAKFRPIGPSLVPLSFFFPTVQGSHFMSMAASLPRGEPGVRADPWTFYFLCRI